MEVLTAYVRQHARQLPSWERGGQEGGEEAPVEKIWRGAPDIQAIMTVIRRRTHSFNHGEPEGLDLRETNLTGANLEGTNLVQAQLETARGDGYTRLPSDLNTPAHWGVKTGEQSEED
jgi:Pentapeptide repeats (8 copies)